MTDKTESQIKFLEHIIDNAYNPNIPKKDLHKDLITVDFFNSNSKLLKNLPPLLSPYFSEYLNELLNCDDNIILHYRIIWYGTLLKYLYVGKQIDIPLPGSWLDLASFHDGCCQMLDKMKNK